MRDGGLCRYRYAGCTTVATSVDHLLPRERAPGLMFDETNCFSVCHSCHREKERLERRGEPVTGFLTTEAAGDAPISAYIYGRSNRDRRYLLLSGDYGRQTLKGARNGR
jgi:hypothetical protein